MKKLLSLFIITSLFSGELEVDGNLKVSGNIDAQNKAIKNVGVPQELTDAINGNVLQDALRDDGNYEYKVVRIIIPLSWESLYSYFRVLDSDVSGTDASLYLNQLGNEGWKIINVENTGNANLSSFGNDAFSMYIYVLSRILNDE